MTVLSSISPPPPRSHGAVHVAAKLRDGNICALADLLQSGSARVLMTPARDAVEGVLLNTSGGLTGGDTLCISAEARAGARMRLTTQAAERVYRSSDGRAARMRNDLTIAPGARIDWLPQETILFQNGHLRRSLTVNMAADARALIVEPVLIGRLAMGEVVTQAQLSDSLTLFQDGHLLFKDATALTGNIVAQMNQPALGNGARAMALVVFAAPEAEGHLAGLRATLPPTAGVSLVRDGLLVLRALAEDGFALRRTLIPVLDRLSGNALPRSWRL